VPGMRRWGVVAIAACLLGCGWFSAAPAGAAPGPQLNSLSISPSTVDITSSDAVVTVQMRIVSTNTFASGCIGIDEPSFAIEYTGGCFNASNLIGGSLLNGLYQLTLTIRHYAHTGFYPVDEITLRDTAGAATEISGSDLAAAGMPSGLNVTGTSDVTPPTLVSVAFSASSGDLATGPFTATVTAHVTDAQSGYVGDCIDFGGPLAPSASALGVCLIDPQQRISGTQQDGVYQTTLTIPQSAVPGVYPLLDYHVQDDAGNFVNLTPAQVESAGAPAAITLTNSSDSAPGSPAGVTATTGNASAGVSWNPPASNGGAALIGYTVTASPGGKTATVSGTTTSATVTGLTNGTTYTFTVHATNGIGASGESSPSNSVTPEASPQAPTAVIATSGTGQASISWTAPASDGGSPITGYTVTQSGSSCGPSGPVCASATVPASATSANVTGLFNGTAYAFTVHATNAIGNGPESAPSNTITTALGPSNPPPFISASGGNQRAQLQWQVPVNDGGSPIISYTATASPGGQSVTVPVSSSSPQGATLTGLANATTYTFTVHATNAFGNSVESAPSSPVLTSGPADAPTGVHATAGNGSATISWTAPFNEGSAIYDYVITASPGGKKADAAPPKTSVTMTGLTNGKTYTFTVSGSNGGGAGAVSAPSNAVTIGGASVPARPATPTLASGAATAATGSLRVTYAAVANNGSAITKVTATCVSSNGGATKTGVHTGATVAPITVTGVATKKSYRCTITATNAHGTSVASPASAAVVVGSPGAPAKPTVTRTAKGALKVAFAAPANNGAAISSYTAACVSSNSGVPKSKTATATQITVTGLTGGKSYTCTVRATNSRGAGPPSSASKATTA
jgi:Fibronectin type III domain